MPHTIRCDALAHGTHNPGLKHFVTVFVLGKTVRPVIDDKLLHLLGAGLDEPIETA